MRLSLAFGVPPSRLRQELTHREFLALDKYLREEWNEPSRSDWYLMQVAAEIRAIGQSFSKTPKPVRLQDLKIEFKEERRKEKKPLTKEERAKIAKAIWMARLNG